MERHGPLTLQLAAGHAAVSVGRLEPELPVEHERGRPGVDFHDLLDRKGGRQIGAALEHTVARIADVVPKPQPQGHFVGSDREGAAEQVGDEQAEHRELEDREAHPQRLCQRLLSRIECRGSVRRLHGVDVVHGWFLHQRGAGAVGLAAAAGSLLNQSRMPRLSAERTNVVL